MLTRQTLAHAVKRALDGGSSAAQTAFDPSQPSRRNTSCLAGAIATTLIAASPAALAQSTSGSVFGQATKGETVVVENPQTGFHREIPWVRMAGTACRRCRLAVTR